MTTIWHHPNCTTSRRVLQMLQDGGETPEVIDYRNDPPDRETLRPVSYTHLTLPTILLV